MTRLGSAYGRLVLVLASAAIIIDSCGGRTLSESRSGQDGGFDTSSGQGGSGPSSGPGTGSTTTGQGGSGRAGSGVGGSSTGSGGAQMAGRGGGAGAPCSNFGCPDIGCGPGYTIVLKPGACCPSCEPIPCSGACAIFTCPSGTHLEKNPAECCPKCVPDPIDTCRKGQQAYAELRKQLIDKYNSIGCRTSRDCTIVYESNRCAPSCGTAFPVTYAESAQQNLRMSAESNCATCPLMGTPPCAPSSAYCVNGACTMLSGPPPP
jgi:hypothetical protein